jgi:hypothetical protein
MVPPVLVECAENPVLEGDVKDPPRLFLRREEITHDRHVSVRVIEDPRHSLRGFLEEPELELDLSVHGLHGIERLHDVPDPSRRDCPRESLTITSAMEGEEVLANLGWDP